MNTAPGSEEALYRLCGLWMKIMNRMSDIEGIPVDSGAGTALFPSEIHTLQVIRLCSGITVSGLADAMGITKSAASQMTRRLVEKRFCEKVRLPGNEREVRLTLTTVGEAAFRGHEQHHGWIRRRIREEVGELGEEEYVLLAGVFEALNTVYEEMRGGNGAPAKGEAV
jgi:DNA-binding MarR family transcriptional regulator